MTLSAALLLLVLAGTHDVSAGLVGHWRLDDGSGTTAADSSPFPASGSVNPGVLTNYGSPVSDWNQGLTGASDGLTIPHGLRFNGGLNGSNGNHIDLDAHTSDFNSLTQGSMAAWFRRDVNAFSTQGDGTILGFGNAAANPFFRIQIEFVQTTNKIELQVLESNNTSETLRVPFTNDGNWHHVVFTSDGSSSTLYYDGVLVGTSSLGFLTDTYDTFRIGNTNRNGVNNWFFDGTLADVRIYSEAIDQATVDLISDPNNIDSAPVPEPSSLALLGIGSLGLIGYARRRRSPQSRP